MTINNLLGISLVNCDRMYIKPAIDKTQNNNKAMALDMRRFDSQSLSSAKYITRSEFTASKLITDFPCF